MSQPRPRLFYVLALLFAINLLNFYDRQIPGVIAEPLRKEFNLSDQDLGWITTAFVLVYAAVSMPLGHWADVGKRKWILAIGVWVWSAFTSLSGMAWGFWSLFALRLGVGVGEASCAPASNSLIGDMFPAEKRGRAISIFMLGLPLGLGLSSLISGEIAQHSSMGWRAAYLVAGIPGVILGFLCLFIPEPARGAAEKQHVGAARREGSTIVSLLKIPTLWWIIVSGILHNFNMYAIGQFLSSYLERWHGTTTSEAGRISSINYTFGGLGILLGGFACDWMVRRRMSGRLEVATLALALGGPCIYMALLQPREHPFAFAAWLIPGSVMFYVYYAAVYASIADIVEPTRRGAAMGLYFLAMYFLGAAAGPVLLGRLSDYFARQSALQRGVEQATEWDKAVGLHDAFFIVPILAGILVIVLFAASRTVTKDYQRLQRWIADASEKPVAS